MISAGLRRHFLCCLFTVTRWPVFYPALVTCASCDLPFIPAAAKSKCMGQENKWNDQHCWCSNKFSKTVQYETMAIEKCFVALFLSFGQWDIFLSSFIGPLLPAISIRKELWQWEICFLSRLKLTFVHYMHFGCILWLQNKILSSIISKHFLFFSIMLLFRSIPRGRKVL